MTTSDTFQSPDAAGIGGNDLRSPVPRFAIVLSHPTQYYSPWFAWLRRHTALEFRVFYLWEFGVTAQRDPQFQATFKWDVDLLSGYDSEFVPNLARDPGTHHFFGLRNPALTARLAAWHPDALLIFGYNYATHLRAILWARLHRVPLVFRGDSHFIGRAQPGPARRLALRMLYAQFAAITYVGAANRDYFTALHVPARRLFFAPHAVNADLFNPARPAPHVEAAALRARLGIASGVRVACFAGKLVAAKQPRELLAAFLALDLPDTALVFVGDGEEKPALIEQARDAARGRVYFLPFANQTEMPARYLLADIFALPSRGLYETWGLAVNEAMHMGVPCLVSDRVGCQRDLVTDGETGWVFAAANPAQLQASLRRALTSDLTPLKSAVARRIAGYSYRSAAAGLAAALATATMPSAILPAR